MEIDLSFSLSLSSRKNESIYKIQGENNVKRQPWSKVYVILMMVMFYFI